MSEEQEESVPQAPPALRVLTPDATDEEVAALVAVLSSMGGGEDKAPPRRPEWAAHHRRHRTPLHPGPGGWRGSAYP